MTQQIIKVGNRKVGAGLPPFVIAEAGSNHDGSLKRAKELVHAAADMGADAVKFQSFSGPGLVNQKLCPEVFRIIEKVKLPEKWIPELAAVAKKRDVLFMSTPFDEAQADILNRAGMAAFKIASGDLTHLPLIEHVARKKKPIFLSVGVGDLGDVEEAVNTILAAGNDKIILMHCVVSYPAKPEDANLKVIDTLRDAFGIPVGFSDHTEAPFVTVAAVARGACVVEKHFTFSRALPGPDHPYAIEVEPFKHLIQAIKRMPEALGSPRKCVLDVEKPELVDARRAVYARADIRKGTAITKAMLVCLRPARGLAPREIPNIIGRTATRDIEAHDPISWDALSAE